LLLDPDNDSVELHIAGTGPDAKRLKQFVEDEAIPRVTFHGYITEDEKLALLRGAQLFCSAAPYGESFGIVLLEAMAIGIPIVAGDNPGYRSVMEGRGNISIVNPRDIEALRDRLHLLIHDEQLRQLWRRWAREYVKQFSYERVVDQYEQLYKETCHK
jgi:phosphatidyl-myo-inositol alpha-mannosyltransferase